MVTILPWIIRNRLVVGTCSLSTNGGIVLMIGNNAFATGRQIWDDNVQSLLGDLAATENGMFDGKEVAREARARSVALSYILDHPLTTIALWPQKFIALYASDVDGMYYTLGMRPSGQSGLSYFLLRGMAEFYYLFILRVFSFSLPGVLRERRLRPMIGLAIIAYFTATYLIFFANARYHFALMPWFAMYAGVALAAFLRHPYIQTTNSASLRSRTTSRVRVT